MGRKANTDAAAEALDPERASLPEVVRLNEARVRSDFWPKIVRVAARIPFARDATALWFCARDPETPMAAKGMMLAALAYFVLPMDAIPDVLAGVGYTDDAAVIAAVLSLIGANLKPRHRQRATEALRRLGG